MPVVPTVVRLQRRGGRVVQDCDVYIGRECRMGGWTLDRSKWANPFSITVYGSAEVACARYKLHVERRPDLLAALHELDGQRLGCWCKGRNICHGDILVELFELHCMQTPVTLP